MANDNKCYSIKMHDDLLAVRLLCSWDLTMTRQFCEDARQGVALTLPSQWGLIADISHWCLETESSCEYFYQFHRACIAQGMTHQAIILPRSSLKRWRIKAFISSHYTIKSYLADTEQDAVNWMRSKGFRFNGFSSELITQ